MNFLTRLFCKKHKRVNQAVSRNKQIESDCKQPFQFHNSSELLYGICFELSGNNKDAAITRLASAIKDGFDKHVVLFSEMMHPINSFLQSNTDYFNKADQSKIYIDTFQMTLPFAIELYLILSSQTAFKKLNDDCFQLANILDERSPLSLSFLNSKNVKTVMRILSEQFNNTDKELISLFQNVCKAVLKKYGEQNELSHGVGIDVNDEHFINFYPIITTPVEFLLKNDWYAPLTNAVGIFYQKTNDHIRIYDPLATISFFAEATAKYCTIFEPIRSFEKVYNRKIHDDSMRSIYGNEISMAIDQLLFELKL